MRAFETAEATQPYRARCEDRVAVLHLDNRVILAIADGAGGTGGGAAAAEHVVRAIHARASGCRVGSEWVQLLAQLDHEVGPGQCTAVVVDLTTEGVCGASVGDSHAWQVHDGEILDLTAGQIRKPLLGSGAAQPVGFCAGPLHGVLLAGTDGFFNYAKRTSVPPLVSQADFFSLPRQLIASVRLPSGDFWDDIGIVVCRSAPVRATRQRYVL